MNQITEYYLVEVNKQGEESPLTQNYSNSFMKGATPNTAFKFTEEEKVKQACKIQNMLAGIFNNGTKTYYVKQDVTRTKLNEKGEPYTLEDE
ncbi:hypothetical protein I0P04_002198 [Staphylococcus pseudintermedius]|nr:hypothetical protein [Staphylococcus pseudintermedius]HCA7797095.1 hypothetical protein [Staphylococcus pseudintermedius]